MTYISQIRIIPRAHPAKESDAVRKVEADKAWTETGEFKAVLVDGKTVKADTFYQLKDGELVEFTYKNENETGEVLP